VPRALGQLYPALGFELPGRRGGHSEHGRHDI
jgi:hypothetical protein